MPQHMHFQENQFGPVLVLANESEEPHRRVQTVSDRYLSPFLNF